MIKRLTSFSVYSSLIIVSILAPKFNTLDNVTYRWTMVSLVNLLFIFNHLIIKRQSYYFNSRLLTLFLSLLIFSIISTYYSINITESIISLNKLFIIISTIVCCSICIEKENKVLEILLKILFLSLAFECIFTIVDFFLWKLSFYWGFYE